MQRPNLGFHLLQIIGSLDPDLKQRKPNYPPMDIIRTSDTSVELHFAIAGFAPSDIEITTENRLLRVKGSIPESTEQHYLVRGIAKRAFDHRFELSTVDKVSSASFVDGLLKIKLEAVIPEDQKLKIVPIG